LKPTNCVMARSLMTHMPSLVLPGTNTLDMGQITMHLRAWRWLPTHSRLTT